MLSNILFPKKCFLFNFSHFDFVLSVDYYAFSQMRNVWHLKLWHPAVTGNAPLFGAWIKTVLKIH